MLFRRNRLLFIFLLNSCLVLVFFRIYPYLFRPHFISTFKSLTLTEIERLENLQVQAEPAPEVRRFEDSLSPASTMQDVLLKYRFTPQEAQRLIEETRRVYNLNRVMAGNRFLIEFEEDRFAALQYDISDEEYLVVKYDGTAYSASRHPYEFDTVVEEFYGQIDGSLSNTLVSNGENYMLVANLMDILMWDIPFTMVQPGDSFKLILEKKYRDGQFIKYGRILAVEFRRGEKTFYAFLFNDPKTGKPRYYDVEGKGVRKAFLKVPFRFNPRVTSRYTNSRYHPILKRRRPHLGVDFGAPVGTPVLASASGTVIFAGRDGGYGRMVRIRHSGGMVTSYAHLSRISVKAGQAVAQMDVVGRVGSSGLSTGPHLDYRVQDSRGRFLNPMNLVSLPSDEPIAKQYAKDFEKIRDGFRVRLAAIPEHQPYLNRVAAGG